MWPNIISCELCYDNKVTVYEIFKDKTLCKPCLKKIKLKYVKAKCLIDNIANIHFCLTEIAVCKTNDSEKEHLDDAKQQLKKSMRKINLNLSVMRPVHLEVKW